MGGPPVEKFSFSISAVEPYPTKEHVTNRKERYALDNIRDLAGAVAAWTRELLHAGWVYSHPACHCDRSLDHPVDPRPAAAVDSNR